MYVGKNENKLGFCFLEIMHLRERTNASDISYYWTLVCKQL